MDDSGNLGIGTTNPSAALSVGSTSQFQVASTGSVTMADGTLLDLSGIIHNDSGSQGLILPQNTSLTSPGTGEGYIAWNSNDDEFKVCDGSN